MSGSFLVLVTWAFVIVSCVAIGYGITTNKRLEESITGQLRYALWWGFAVAVLGILALSIAFPLRSAAAAAGMGAVVAGCAGYSIFRYVTRSKNSHDTKIHLSVFAVLLLIALAAAVVFFAVAALGPVMNYDSGLYHLGAIKYAGDYSTIPGLANLYFPLGYSNSIFPLAAFLGNGPWLGEGYRLVNGLIITMMLVDLAFRWIRGSRTVGAYVLLVGAVVTLVPMVGLSDYWVTSPTSDSAVLALTMVMSAYLADALWTSANRARNGSTAFVVAVLAVSLRPLMAVFLLAVIGVLVMRYILDKHESATERRIAGQSASGFGVTREYGSRAIWISAGVIAALFGVVQSVRDFIMSGWLQFPLSIHAFDVAWLAPDPVWNRTPTLGAARDPLHLWEAAVGWGWIPVWASRLPSQWETYVILALVVASVISIIVAIKVASLNAKSLLLAMMPALLTCAAWFLASPPSFRFVWGPIFSLGVIPIAWSLFAVAKANKVHLISAFVAPFALVLSSTVILAVVAYAGVTRIHPGLNTQQHSWAVGPIDVSVYFAPVVDVPTKSKTLASGLIVQIPTTSDQCWNVYPLCTAQLSPTVAMRGESLQDGFLP
ncbi:MAG: hypothetical protein F2806_05280 [Actinobacteria bacterium]|uniref:Unannotated protein n=1 Tax=freshwater metagenome TaxID=449393 RepID=A0A6J7G5R9_9ZZZZ|nr:hypothetical protein [Actinomycetota bacterium]